MLEFSEQTRCFGCSSLKARYYPTCHFLQSGRTGGASYTWSGIWQAKEEMKKGLRWVLGDGKTIAIAKDRWLRAKEDFCVDSAEVNAQMEQMRVCDFFRENERSWDENKVRFHFSGEEGEAILNTRIPQGCTRDRIAWVHASNGQYNVKSGYYQWSISQTAVEGIQLSSGWGKLWKLHIPHKMKVVLWRFCRNTIPVRNLLSGRGVPIDGGCSMCEDDVEHMNHLFIDCNYAKECWHEVGLNFDMREEEYAHVWLINMLSSAPDAMLIKIATVIWGIWFARNKRTFESKIMSPSFVISWSRRQVEEWQKANKIKSLVQIVGDNRTRPDHRWKPPEVDQLKINVDASLVAGQNSFAVGMVLRNQQGQYMTGKVMRFAGVVPVWEAELTGVLEALLWSRGMSDGPVMIESDSLLSVKAINQGHVNLLESGDLVQQCQELLMSNGRIVVSHIKKHANKVAHKIARFPCELNCFNVIPSPPSCLLETLLSDVSEF